MSSSILITDRRGNIEPPAPAPARARAVASPAGQPFIPNGGNGGNWNFYDAVNFSQNRQARPFFATDSRATLTSWSRTRAMGLARWAYINVHFVKGAIDLFARLTVGTGFSPKTHSADKGLAAAADEYYAEKTRTLGYMGGESMDELLLHDCRSVDIDGDLGYVMTADEFDQPKLQLIEGHRIKNGDQSDPQCRDGVWVDGYGRRLGFNVALPESEGDATRRIAAQDFLYLAERNRPDELRSMTNLIHALAPLQDLYEMLGFAMQSAKKNSEWAATLETNTPKDLPFGPNLDQEMQGATTATETAAAQPAQTITREMIYGSGGKIPVLRPGEKLSTWAHDSPSPTIEAWAAFIIRGICVGLGTPFEVIWNPESIGGANTRLITALLRARLNQRRATLIFPKLTRVRFWILARGIKRGELRYSPDLFKCSWNPNFVDITVDAGRESRERRTNVQCGLDTHTGYFSENGAAYSEQLGVREADTVMQCESAERLVKQFPWLTPGEALARMALLTAAGSEMPEGPSGKQESRTAAAAASSP